MADLYTDAHLDYYGEYYVRHGVGARLGLAFEDWLRICVANRRPLCPSAATDPDVVLGVEAALPPDARLIGGTYLEPLRHHRYTDNRARYLDRRIA